MSLQFEEDEGFEGQEDPDDNLSDVAKALLLSDNQKAKLFEGFLARHFFRGVALVSKRHTVISYVMRDVMRRVMRRVRYVMRTV